MNDETSNREFPVEVLTQMMGFRDLRSLNKASKDYVINEYIDSLIVYPTSEEIKTFLEGRRAWGCGFEMISSGNVAHQGGIIRTYHSKDKFFGSSSLSIPLFENHIHEDESTVDDDEIYQMIKIKTIHRFDPLDEYENYRRFNPLLIHFKFIFLDILSIMEFHHQKSEFILAKKTYGEALCHHRLKLAMINLISSPSSSDNYEGIRTDYAVAYINCQVMKISHPLINPKIYKLKSDLVKLGDNEYHLFTDPNESDQFEVKSALIYEDTKTMIELITKKIESM